MVVVPIEEEEEQLMNNLYVTVKSTCDGRTFKFCAQGS
jgi:hypothetical protein